MPSSPAATTSSAMYQVGGSLDLPNHSARQSTGKSAHSDGQYSGSKPAGERLTLRLKSALDCVDVRLLDNFIIGKREPFSFASTALL